MLQQVKLTKLNISIKLTDGFVSEPPTDLQTKLASNDTKSPTLETYHANKRQKDNNKI